MLIICKGVGTAVIAIQEAEDFGNKRCYKTKDLKNDADGPSYLYVNQTLFFHCLEDSLSFYWVWLNHFDVTLMFNFAKDQKELGEKLFLAWTGWVFVWISLLLFLGCSSWCILHNQK
ncbi:Boron transporter like [Quillaja saponaria]|uniref:Boron transporter like n=1 Tax=Quillaja saponaria TaxID=32244 RepID=A0AAD7LHZ3_QUISA|nr:Boron transporter like [Quillaja saponaria]